MRITHAQREMKASFFSSIPLAKLKHLLSTSPCLFTQTLTYIPNITYLNSPPAVSAFRAVIKLVTGNSHEQAQHKCFWCPDIPSLGSRIRDWVSYQ